MKLIGFTQRIDVIPSRNEVRECLDYRLPLIFNKLDYICIPISAYSTKKSLKNLFRSLNGFVLTGGNNIGEYSRRDELENFILEYSASQKIPVLGICRGMQSILNYEKFSLVRVENHVKKRHKIVIVDKNQTIEVNSYHQFGILHSSIVDPFKSLAYSLDNFSEYIQHNIYPWTGIMWHPEREKKISEFDYKLISRVFNNESI